MGATARTVQGHPPDPRPASYYLYDMYPPPKSSIFVSFHSSCCKATSWHLPSRTRITPSSRSVAFAPARPPESLRSASRPLPLPLKRPSVPPRRRPLRDCDSALRRLSASLAFAKVTRLHYCCANPKPIPDSWSYDPAEGPEPALPCHPLLLCRHPHGATEERALSFRHPHSHPSTAVPRRPAPLRVTCTPTTDRLECLG